MFTIGVNSVIDLNWTSWGGAEQGWWDEQMLQSVFIGSIFATRLIPAVMFVASEEHAEKIRYCTLCVGKAI